MSGPMRTAGRVSGQVEMARRSPISVELKRLRERAGLTQGQLADRASVARETVTRLESGRQMRTSVGTMDKLARALGVPVSAFYSVPPSMVVETPVEPLLQRFLASPQGRAMDLTQEEIERIRSAGSAYWLGIEPSDDTFALMVLGIRKANRKPRK